MPGICALAYVETVFRSLKPYQLVVDVSVGVLFFLVAMPFELATLTGASSHVVATFGALAVCVVGPEGAAAGALAAAEIVVRSVVEAFDLLLEPKQIVATLRP